MTSNGQVNGTGGLTLTDGRKLEAPPPRVAELAAGCIRFAQRATGVTLDFEPETLSVLDHYVEEGRLAASAKPEVATMVAQAAGAYFGEVVRRRYAGWWRAESESPLDWRIELENVYLSFSPVQLMLDAILRSADADVEAGDLGGLDLEEEDRDAIKARLADLPEVSEAEFYAPSTRLEVIDIAVDAIRARRIAQGEDVEAAFRPEDYEGD